MASYIIRRLLLVVPTLIGITAVVFFVMAMAPGGVGASLLTREGDLKPQERKAIQDYLEKRYGLNSPPPVQYLRWLNKVSPVGMKDPGTQVQPADLQRAYDEAVAGGASRGDAVAFVKTSFPGVSDVRVGPGGKVVSGDVREPEGFPARAKFGLKSPDLGESFVRQRKVSALIAEALPITLLLNLITVPIIYAIAIVTGIQTAKHRGKMLDVGTGTVLLGMWSFPTMLAGVLMIGFLASRQYLKIFPANGLHDIQSDAMAFLPAFTADGFQRGWLLDTAWHLVLPVICLSYGGFAYLSKLQRGAVLENIGLDYVRTARAKGLSEKNVLYRHVFRNSLLPLITVAAHLLPGLLAGSVIIEVIFGLPGMGKLIVEAALMRDRELVLSDVMVISVVGLLSYLLADICYVAADPRVSYDA
jgi:peptide/nickel transport system permease protein